MRHAGDTPAAKLTLDFLWQLCSTSNNLDGGRAVVGTLVAETGAGQRSETPRSIDTLNSYALLTGVGA